MPVNAADGNPELEEVRVTAARNLLGQPLHVAANLSTIAYSDQVSLNRTVADWIERLPGITLNGQGGLLQSYSVRGFSRWRIRTEVDGVPIITDRRAGNAASFVPPDLLAGVDVSRGPGSTLYGSDAMGGVVSLATYQPDSPIASLSSQTNDGATSIMAGARLSPSTTAAAVIRTANTAIAADRQSLDSGYRQAALTVASQTQWRDVDVDVRWLPSIGRDIGKANRGGADAIVSEYPEERHSVLRAELRASDRWLLRLYHHWQDWASLSQRPDGRRNRIDYKAHTVGALGYRATHWLNGLGRIGGEWLGRRGVEIADRESLSTGLAPSVTQLVDGQQDNLGLFVDQQWSVGNFRVGAGARLDHVDQRSLASSDSDDAANASVSVDWVHSSEWRLSARWGTGFRFPTLGEKYVSGATPRGETLGNPLLNPERLQGFELAADWTSSTMSLQATVYRNHVSDYIERYRLTPTLRTFRNTQRAQIEGLELVASWQPSAHWQHQINYQWQQGENREGDWLADLNPPSWRYLLRWHRTNVKFETDILWRFRRSDFGDTERPLDEAIVLNSRANWQLSDNWQAEVYALNVMNELYRGSADEDAPLQPGRTIGVRFVWRG